MNHPGKNFGLLESFPKLNSYFDNEFIENLGDLYYNNLHKFLFSLSQEMRDIEGSDEILEAAEVIELAWNLSKKYIDKNNLPQKHENAEAYILSLGGIDYIISDILKLDRLIIGQILFKLSHKLWMDGEKDSKRPSLTSEGIESTTKKRVKLTTYLFAASLDLKKAANKLKKV